MHWTLSFLTVVGCMTLAQAESAPALWPQAESFYTGKESYASSRRVEPVVGQPYYAMPAPAPMTSYPAYAGSPSMNQWQPNVSNWPMAMPSLNMPNISMPSMPTPAMPNMSVPSFPNMNMPSMPNMSNMNMPSMPNMNMPSMSFPSMPMTGMPFGNSMMPMGGGNWMPFPGFSGFNGMPFGFK